MVAIIRETIAFAILGGSMPTTRMRQLPWRLHGVVTLEYADRVARLEARVSTLEQDADIRQEMIGFLESPCHPGAP